MTDRELFKMALDVLLQSETDPYAQVELSAQEDSAIEALRARLAQPEPEPVAWMYEFGSDSADAINEVRWYQNVHLTKPTGMVRNVVPLYTAPPQQPKQEPVAWWHDKGDVIDLNVSGHGTPLYTAPPKKEWISLTDDDLHALHYELKCAAMGATSTLGMYRILEKASKEKNGY